MTWAALECGSGHRQERGCALSPIRILLRGERPGCPSHEMFQRRVTEVQPGTSKGCYSHLEYPRFDNIYEDNFPADGSKMHCLINLLLQCFGK